MAPKCLRVSLLWLLFPTAICAQQNGNQVPPPGSSTASVTEPDVLLSLADTQQQVVAWRDLRIQATVVNGSTPAGIGVNKLVLSIPTDLGVTTDQPSDTPGSAQMISGVFQMRTPGDRRDLPILELRAKRWGEAWGRLTPMITYRPQSEVFVATLTYQPLDGATPRTKTVRLSVPVTPNPVGMYFGALLGVLLAALLVPLHRIATSAKRFETAKEIWTGAPLEASRILADIAQGVVATAIAVLVFQTTSNFSFPVSISVHDFYGGVLLGLFAGKIANSVLAQTTGGSGEDDEEQNLRAKGANA